MFYFHDKTSRNPWLDQILKYNRLDDYYESVDCFFMFVNYIVSAF